MFLILFNCLGMILCVPFLTLFERKILSYTQKRKGPKKISLGGLLQPLVDGMKLMMKEAGFPSFSKKVLYLFSPMFVFFLSLASCLMITSQHTSYMMKFSILLFLVLVSCKVFPLFFSGAASKSKYSSLGSFRGAAQIIAYEVNMMLMILFPLFYMKSFNIYYFFSFKNLMIIFPFLIFFWIFCMISETNRAPLDFAEGESELVSGFKTEYSGLNFTLLFLAEYSKMIIMSIITSIFFIFKKIVKFLLMIYLFLTFRASFPRFRYDFLMVFGWKVILSSVLFFFSLILIL